MNTEAGKLEEDDNDNLMEAEDDDADFRETIVMTEMPATDGGADTAELQVDALIAQVDAQSDEEVQRRKRVRRRLEQLSEDMNLEDTYAFDLEDAD